MGTLSLKINGKQVTEPKQWADMKIVAAYGDNSNQPEIESDRFILVNDAAREITNAIDNGDIFEGLDAVLTYKPNKTSFTIFDGFIDTSDNYEELEPEFGGHRSNQVSVKFRGKNTIANFTDQINGVTYGFLVDQGTINAGDYTTIKTIIVKKSNFVDIAVGVVMIYLLGKQLQDTIKEIARNIADITAAIAGGLSGAIAGVILTVAIAIINIIYAIALLVLIIKMVKDLIDLLIPPTVQNKGMSYRKLLSKVCDHYGYTFVSPIPELDTFHYLPSKPFSDSQNILKNNIPLNVPTKTGIPAPSDFGYVIPEMFELCKRMFNAKVDVIGNEVHLRNDTDPFWLTTSTFKLAKNPNYKGKKFNTQELSQTRLMSYVTDPNDEYTVENYTGTSFEIKTEPTSPKNIKNVVIKGLERIDLPIALPSSKTKLTNIENVVIELASLADAFTKLIGKKSTLANDIAKNRINVLKISNNDYSIAKVVPLVNGVVPPNHRSLTSAKTLMDKYHASKSFVSGNKLGQKVLYSQVEIPFTLLDYLKTFQNGRFTLPSGKLARFRNIEWQFSRDIAVVDFEVQEVYTNKLTEKQYEP